MGQLVTALATATCLAALTCCGPRAAAPGAAALPRTDDRLINTYSVVARDAETGAMGVAVQSHWFQVGTMVSWAEAGVGAVATQALTNASFGPRGLAALRAGMSPERALQKLLRADENRDQRQVAIVDSRGRVAARTGKRCLPAAGHLQGEGFSVQANMMTGEQIWPAMKQAYEASLDQPLAERLLATLAAAEVAGGDIRGAQSAALVVVPAKATGDVTADRPIDLRVADHPRPIDELARLLRLRRAYDASAAGDRALARGEIDEAQRLFARARELAGADHELVFWQAVSLYGAGERDAGRALFRQIFAVEPRYRVVLRRLPPGGILTEAQVEAILGEQGDEP